MRVKVTKIVHFEMAHQLDNCYSEEQQTFTCPLCKKENIKSIFSHFSAMSDWEHIAFMESFDTEVSDFIDSMIEDHMQIEINKELQKHLPFMTPVSLAHRIRSRVKELGLDSRKVMGEKRRGENNPVNRNPNTKIKIANSVAERWKDGNYVDRINGMLGRCGEDSPVYKEEIHTPEFVGEYKWHIFLKEFQDTSECVRCKSITNKMNIHHVDEDHKNFLPSNLEPLCVSCHTKFHYTRHKNPFAIIGKEFYFAAAHQLPEHQGNCRFLHGHEWKVRIELKKRIDPETGMVMDFSNLKKIVNAHVISVLDHSTLNEVIYNPTAENILVWIWERLMFDGLLKGIYRIHLWESRDSVALIDQDCMLSVFKSKGCTNENC